MMIITTTIAIAPAAPNPNTSDPSRGESVVVVSVGVVVGVVESVIDIVVVTDVDEVGS